MHTFIYLGISFESYEQQFGKIYRFEKALLVIKFTKYCYWGSVGLENIGSDWGHLTNFQFSDIFVVFVCVCCRPLLQSYQTAFLSSISPICGPRSGIIWRLRLISCLSFHISGCRQLFRFVSVPPHLPASLSHLTIHPEKKLCKCPTWPHMLLIRASDSVKHESQSQAGLVIVIIIHHWDRFIFTK